MSEEFRPFAYPDDEQEAKEKSKVERFRSIATSLADLYELKNHDYGDSFGQTFQKLGIISAITRISDKYNRIVSLATNKEQKVKDEAIEDTLKDMASYCIMTLIELGYDKKEK